MPDSHSERLLRREMLRERQRLPLRLWNRNIRRRLGMALMACLSIIFFWPAALVSVSTNQSLSGTWMTHFSASALFHSTRLDNAIADLAKAKVNTLYPAVWDHGHTLHSSAVLAKAGGSHRNP